MLPIPATPLPTLSDVALLDIRDAAIAALADDDERIDEIDARMTEIEQELVTTYGLGGALDREADPSQNPFAAEEAALRAERDERAGRRRDLESRRFWAGVFLDGHSSGATAAAQRAAEQKASDLVDDAFALFLAWTKKDHEARAALAAAGLPVPTDLGRYASYLASHAEARIPGVLV